MKTRILLTAAVMFVALSAVVVAQVGSGAVWDVSSIPVTAVIKTGNAELPGAIKFIPFPGSTQPSVSGTVQILYGGNPGIPITSPWGSTPPAIHICTDAVSATGGVVTLASAACSGFASYPNEVSNLKVDVGQSVYSPGVLVIDVPAALATGSGDIGSFIVTGVRLKINGSGLSATTPVVAYISMQGGNQLVAGEDHPTVINSLADGIADVASYTSGVPITTASTAGAPSLAPLSGVLSGLNTTIAIHEGFGAAFTKGVGVRITLSAAPPKGVTIAFPTTAQTSYDSVTIGSPTPVNANWGLGNATSTTVAGTSTFTSTSTSLSVYYYLSADTSSGVQNIEYLEIPVTLSGAASVLPVTASSITYTVSLAPVEGAYQLTSDTFSTEAKLDALLAPRFAAAEVGPANMLTISPSTAVTVLMMPYASTQSGFDTGIAIANTTTDPGSTAMGITGAVAQTGPITFYFFPTGATAFSVASTTFTAPTSWNLNSAGALPTGSTFVGLLSNLLVAAGQTTTAAHNFSGYIIVVTGFTNAHGIFTVSNFSSITAYSALMEVLGYGGARTAPEVVYF